MRSDQIPLFPGACEPAEPSPRADRAGPKFREAPEFTLFPDYVDDRIPPDHDVRYIESAVYALDIGPLLRTYSFRGGYGYDPRPILCAVVYGMTHGVRACSDLEQHCIYDMRYRFLMKGQEPDERTFQRFLDRVEPFLSKILSQVLHTGKKAGLVNSKEAAIDGCKNGGDVSWWKYRKESQERPSDPDAKIMASHGRFIVGYNAQIAVDTSSGVIIGADVLNDEADWHVAGNFMEVVKEQFGELPYCVIADSGYESPETIQTLGEMGIETVINPREGLKECLTLNHALELVCPAGKLIVQTSINDNHGRRLANFRPEGGCRNCPLSATCAFKGDKIQLTPGADPAAKYLNKARVESSAYRGALIRRRLVEQAFASFKRHDNFGLFRRRGLKKARAEFLLWVISYDIRKLARAFERAVWTLFRIFRLKIESLQTKFKTRSQQTTYMSLPCITK